MSWVAGAATLGAAAEPHMDPQWPPVLIFAVVALVVLCVATVALLFRRFHAAARDERLRPKGWRHQ